MFDKKFDFFCLSSSTDWTKNEYNCNQFSDFLTTILFSHGESVTYMCGGTNLLKVLTEHSETR